MRRFGRPYIPGNPRHTYANVKACTNAYETTTARPRYALNIGYNIYNKKALNIVDLPWTMAAIQLFAGIPYVMLLWATGLRKAPVLTKENIKNLTPSGTAK